MPEVGLVLVSHSADLARGAVELAAQMAPAVPITPAGGMDDGSLGTSYDVVWSAVEQTLAQCDHVLVLADLGSAVLTVESVIDMQDVAGRVRLADAPFVEGAVASAVAAQGGASWQEVHDAAVRSVGVFAPVGVDDGGGSVAVGTGRDSAACGRVTVRNAMGLHARPAAVIAQLAGSYAARVTIEDVDARSVLEVMGLGVQGGRELRIEALGPDAEAAVAAVVALIDGGFGEL